MNCPTVGELRSYATKEGTSDVVSRALLLTLGTLDDSIQLTWAIWSEVCVRCFYENEPVVEVMLAAGARQAIRDIGQQLANLPEPAYMAEDEEIPQLSIGMADDTWCTWSGANAFYHKETGAKIKQLSQPALQTFTMDFTVLWYRCRAKLAQFREEQNAANPVPEPTDASGSPV